MHGAGSRTATWSRPESRRRRDHETNDGDISQGCAAYFRHTLDALFQVAVTPEGRFYYEDINPADEHAIGLGAEVIRGKAPHECLPPETADSAMAHYRECASLGTAIRYESVLTVADRTREFETTLTPIRDGSGRVVRLIGACRDITDLKHQTRQFETTRRLFERIAEATPNILYVYDLTTRSNVYVNHRVTDIIGISIDQLRRLGSDLIPALVHPDDLAAVRRHYSGLDAIGDDEIASLEYRVRHASGRYRWMLVHETAFARGVDGAVTQIIGVASDVTSRRAMEQRLRRSEEQFRLMADTVPNVMFVTGKTGSSRFLNSRFYELTGLPEGAGRGYGWKKAIHPDDLEWLEKLDGPDAVFERELRLRAPNGRYRWSLCRARPIRNVRGAIEKWFGSATDIDDLKQAQQSLAKANQRLEAIIASISDCYLTIDRDYRITAVNPNAARWYGVKASDLIGASYLDAIATTAPVSSLVVRAMETGQPHRRELPSTIRRGRWVELSIYPSPDGATLFFREITDRIMAEQDRAQANIFLQAIIDALSAHIAILDERGDVIAVNSAWSNFAASAGYRGSSHGVGRNYLDVCRRAAKSDRRVSAVIEGLEALLSGTTQSFWHVYRLDCAPPQWFQMRATVFAASGQRRVLVSHEDITAVKTLDEASRQLNARLLDAQEQERRRIARELHDSTAQHMTALGIGLTRLKAHVGQGAAAEIVGDMRQSLSEAHDELRVMSYLLHPPFIEREDLSSSLRHMLDGFASRTGLEVQLKGSPANPELPADIKLAFFRVTQEALLNVHKHARASRVDVRLSTSRRFITLEIRDDGVGVPWEASDDTPAAGLGVGVLGMRARMEQFGGTLTVRRLRSGTAVRATIPAVQSRKD
jgi:PAS domain S-box-containing protein